MGKVFKIVDLNWDEVRSGIEVEAFTLQGAGVTIPAILLGGEGRGRRLGVVPVVGAEPGQRIYAARVGTTRSGRPKLIAAPVEEATEEGVIVALLNLPGYRGEAEVSLPNGDPLPKEWVLGEGVWADGAAGRLGRSPQLLLILPEGASIRWSTTGRTYGSPHRWIYRAHRGSVIALPEELADLGEDLVG